MPVASEVKLAIYNGALARLGARKISSLTEAREPRRVLDDWWGASDNAVKWALSRGGWNFAIRAQMLDYSPSVEPEFGFRRAFGKPTDFVRLETLSASEYFTLPLTADQYTDEAGYWLSNLDVMYVRYVSDGDSYGLDTSRWTEDFKHLLETYLAFNACDRLTEDERKKQLLERDMMRALKEAKSNDAMDEGTKFRPPGSWVQSRGTGYRRDRWRS